MTTLRALWRKDSPFSFVSLKGKIPDRISLLFLGIPELALLLIPSYNASSPTLRAPENTAPPCFSIIPAEVAQAPSLTSCGDAYVFRINDAVFLDGKDKFRPIHFEQQKLTQNPDYDFPSQKSFLVEPPASFSRASNRALNNSTPVEM
ncbi:hypothetical protein C8J56DRAFT_1052178 [Mycena floridula]|nr:hypothetical protein C8J56DRAFT_1052178 [Mycena floridula]